MAWNEPGGGKQRDPWKDGGGGGSSPDFDAILKRISGFFGRLIGGGGGGGSGGGGGGFVVAIVGILLAWVVLDSWVLIKATESGVALRFGKFSRVLSPGFNLKFPRPIESVTKVDATTGTTTDQVRMLTRDENIVLVDFNVQYAVADAQRFLFGGREPYETLKQSAESAVRTVIGASDMDTILSGQRTELMAKAKVDLQKTLDQYATGLTVSELNFQNLRPPPEVRDAFDDANRALQDKQRAEQEAQAYASQVVPESRGDASRIRQASEGYKAERIARAEGDTQRFNLVEAQYKAAPEVTRKRLYLETLQEVLGSTPKVIDFSAGKNLLYLPIAPGGTTMPPEPLGATVTVTPDAGKGSR
jgi:modulator of FtsH protease HflK